VSHIREHKEKRLKPKTSLYKIRPIPILCRRSALRAVWICRELQYEDYCSPGCDAVYIVCDINISTPLITQQI